jgi:hypothetical protein
MAKQNDLTAQAIDGYNGLPNQYLYSSANYIAHLLGRFLHDTGRTNPRNVRMSRGLTIHANDMLFRWEDRTSHFERLK